MAVLFRKDCTSVFIENSILPERKGNVLSVPGFKIASHNGFSAPTASRKNFLCKGLPRNNILYEIEFLEVNLPVFRFLKFEP